jgi:hypothetical protein
MREAVVSVSKRKDREIDLTTFTDRPPVPLRVRLAGSLVVILPIIIVGLCGLAVWAVGPR